MSASLQNILDTSTVMVIDGSMSTALEKMGLDLNHRLWTAKALAENPDMVKQVHMDYFRAGADCGITCSYQASIPGLKSSGYTEEEAENLIRLSVELFLEARDEWWEKEGRAAGRTWPLCLAGMGPYGAYLADGSEYTGAYQVSDAELTAFHARRAELLLEAGADLLLFETQPSLHEVMLEARIAEQMGADYWISFSCRDGKHNGKGEPISECASALAEKGKKVLVIDTDPQGNTTSGFGIDKNEIDHTIYELMIGECSIDEVITKNVVKGIDGVDIIPSNVNLAAVEIELIDSDNKEYILREAISSIRDDYDFIIIDCPPSLSMLTVNAMTTANTVLVPIQCEYYALEGLSQLVHTVNLVKDRLNPELDMEGVVFTMFDSRTNLSLQVVENVKEHIQENVYKTIIPRNIRLAEAPSYGLPINVYEPKSAGAEAYRLLANEVIDRKFD